MTVNLSINDLINKNYDSINYKELIENGILNKKQVKSIMIIKNIQDNNILLSINEKNKLKDYFNNFIFDKEIEEEKELEEVEEKEEQKEEVEEKEEQKEEVYKVKYKPKQKEEQKKEQKKEEKEEEDPNLMTCPAAKIKKKTYKIKYLNDQYKLKRLALL